jgi:mRNA interferase MazF
MVINQGDIFWIELDEPSGSAPGYRHPHVVIQNNVFNRSRINTVVVCALTSNLRRASDAPRHQEMPCSNREKPIFRTRSQG